MASWYLRQESPVKKKAQHCVDTESTEKLVFLKFFVIFVFPEYLSFQKEECYLFFSFFFFLPFSLLQYFIS